MQQVCAAHCPDAKSGLWRHLIGLAQIRLVNNTECLVQVLFILRTLYQLREDYASALNDVKPNY